MDDAASMGVGHRLADLFEDPEESGPLLVRGPAFVQQGRQGAALDQLHGEIGPAVTQRSQLVDRDDPRVLELAADPGLLDEAPDQLGAVAVFLQQHLDGQVAAEVPVPSPEDRPHAAAGDLAEDLVTA